MFSATVRRGLVIVPGLVLSAVLAAHQATQTQAGQSPNAPKPTGFVLGTVVDATTGAPIAGAIVDIMYYGPVTDAVVASPDFAPQPRTDAPRRVVTDAQGRFVFRELPGGRYSVTSRAAGFEFGGYLQTKPGATVHYLDLEDGARRGDVQIRLWKPGSISGTVVDEAGEPAVGVTVKALRRAMSGGKLRLSVRSTAATDDRGVYRLPELSAGEYVVGIVTTRATLPLEMANANAATQSQLGASIQTFRDAAAPSPLPIAAGARIDDVVVDLSAARNGYTPPQPGDDSTMQVYATTFFPNATSAAQATPVVVKSGEERTGINLSLALTSAVRVSGTVTGPDGPGRNLLVWLMPQTADEFWQDPSFETATATTNANGAFTLAGVPPGQYTLKTESATAAGRGAPAPVADLLARGGVSPGPPPFLWARVPINVGSRPVTDVVVNLARGIVVSGSLAFEGSKAKPAPAQLASIGVSLLPLGPRTSARIAIVARADANGQFTSPGAPAGAYYVNVAPPPPGWMLRSVVFNGRNVADEPLALDGNDVAGVVVTFTDKLASISGSVTDAAGAPDTSADVIIFPADSDTWKQGAFNSRRTRLMGTTKSGVYEFTSLPAGDYFLAAVSTTITDTWQDPKFLTKLQSIATRFTIAEGEKKTQALRTTVLR